MPAYNEIETLVDKMIRAAHEHGWKSIDDMYAEIDRIVKELGAKDIDDALNILDKKLNEKTTKSRKNIKTCDTGESI